MLSDEQRKLVEDNLNLVYFYIHRYKLPVDDSDIGYIALCKAAKTYDESKGAKFSTYAMFCIQNAYRLNHRKSKYKENELTMPVITLPDGNETDLASYTPDIIYDTIACYNRLEFTNNLKEYINSLNELDKDIFMSVLAKEKQDSLAKRVKLSQSYVSRKVKRLRDKFKRIYYPNKSIQEIEEEFYGTNY